MRLIDADILKKRFDEREADDIELYGGVRIAECFHADDAKEIVDKMPTVDAVEVVRCKDCKHYMEHPEIKRMCCYVHLLTPHHMKEDDFCSYGERKEQ